MASSSQRLVLFTVSLSIDGFITNISNHLKSTCNSTHEKLHSNNPRVSELALLLLTVICGDLFSWMLTKIVATAG